MSFKTIAVDSRVYKKLADQKIESESFTKTIDRLVDTCSAQGTCANAMRHIAEIVHTPLSDEEMAILEQVVEDNRRNTNWNPPSWS